MLSRCRHSSGGAPGAKLTLPKIPSKLAKFHLQIVENRLQFRSKIVPERQVCALRAERAGDDKRVVPEVVRPLSACTCRSARRDP